MKKTNLLLFLFLTTINVLVAQETKYQLSSHILDITQGKPAAHVTIRLSRQNKPEEWIKIDEKLTDKNGRIADFLKQDGKDHTGIYKLTFYTEPYFKKAGQKSFYPFIEIVFELIDNEHYHVPITLSPFGYSTYRGN